MHESSTIRGLERGLQVLKVLRTKAAASTLQDIHATTKLPKPTLLRILRTLEKAGVVRRRLADGRYQIGAEVYRISRKPDRYDDLAEVAGPILDRLCRRIAWPSDLAVPAGDHMEIRESSRPVSPFVINHDQIGHQINWLLSGHGRAYLAFCPEAERQSLLDLLRRSGNPENRLAFQTEKFDRILAETRKRGYATATHRLLEASTAALPTQMDWHRLPYRFDWNDASLAPSILSGSRRLTRSSTCYESTCET
jgi:IclR family mhp operon transcriptional activator